MTKTAKQSEYYVPGPGQWESLDAGAAGFDPVKLESAVSLARSLDLTIGSDLTAMLPDGSRHPNDRPLGPLLPRGETNGVLLRGGRVVTAYGDTERVDVTFSATKSYLSAAAGLAHDAGRLALDDRVGEQIHDGGFSSEQNRLITWRHLLQQTSEWEGELFGLPEWLDRGRMAGGAGSGQAEATTVGGSAALAGEPRSLQAPGTFWEYNDVRVNRASLALLRLFGRALPDVVREGIMTRLGMSTTWSWHGYSTSDVDVDGRTVTSVSGGAHWGGGLQISTLDHARFGLLYLRRGRWGQEQILSEAWIDATLEPCALNPAYGLMWWRNHAGSLSRVAGAGAFAAIGAGGNIVFVDPERDVVIVLRWCRQTQEVIDAMLGALG